MLSLLKKISCLSLGSLALRTTDIKKVHVLDTSLREYNYSVLVLE